MAKTTTKTETTAKKAPAAKKTTTAKKAPAKKAAPKAKAAPKEVVEEKVEAKVEKTLMALYSLQQIDTQIDKIRIVRGELPLEVQDLEDEIVGLETRVNNHKTDIETIRIAAFDLLARIGMAGAPEWLLRALVGGGARLRDDGRIIFPRAQVEAAISRAAQAVSLPGYVEDRGISIGGGRVHIGSGGGMNFNTMDAPVEVMISTTPISRPPMTAPNKL